ncbi:MAG: hypothetical protein WCB27_08465 [Thermoguttaceae bacterium]
MDKVATSPPPMPIVVEIMPVCAIAARPLRDNFNVEVERERAASRPAEQTARAWLLEYEIMSRAARSVMDTERNCTKESQEFTPWIPGLTPKEHLDMNIMQQRELWHKKQSNRNLWVNLALIFIAILSAVAAWWAATHPTAIVVSVPAATSTTNSSQQTTKTATP